ncbi:MAG: hypothetical protein P8188_13730 [Gemmatimonadota bacterium]
MGRRQGRSRFSGIARVVVRVALLAGALYMIGGFLAVRLVRDPVVLDPAAIREPSPTLPGPEIPPGGVTTGVALQGVAAASGKASGVGTGVLVRGALSVHTDRSHDAEGTLDEVGAAAARAGLDFVVLGDHVGDWAAEGAEALRPRRSHGVLLIPGVELAVKDVGRVLAVGLDTLPREWLGAWDDLARRVEENGGFLSVVHPRSPRARERWAGLSRPGVHAWESFDISEMARLRQSEPLAMYRVVGLLAAFATGRGHRSLARLWREGTATPALLAYDSARAAGPVVLTGGLNHHPKARIMGGLFPGYEPFFRTVVNHVSVNGALDPDPRRAQEQILEALRAGRLFVTLGDAEGVGDFRVWADAEAPGPTVGAAPATANGLRLHVRLPAGRSGLLPVRILHDGVEVAWLAGQRGESLTWTVPGPGVYRVEVFKGGVRLGGMRYGFEPWILSNPVELAVGAESVAVR